MFIVYCHYFPNGKVYVGITSRPRPEDRWMANGLGYKNQTRVWRAIEKYGWDNIKHVVIARNVNIETAVNMEVELIKLYGATNKQYGYNASPGGWAMSEEGKRKLSKYRIGKKLSPETISKISNRLKGKRPSEKAIKRLKEYNRSRDYSKMVQPNETPILQFDIVSSSFVAEYKSINCAANTYNVDARNIKCCLDEHVTQYIGYLWVYKEKATKEYVTKRLYSAQNPERFCPVKMEDLTTGEVTYYRFAKAAAKANDLKYGSVSASIKKDRVYLNRYVFKQISIPEYVSKTGDNYIQERV